MGRGGGGEREPTTIKKSGATGMITKRGEFIIMVFRKKGRKEVQMSQSEKNSASEQKRKGKE